MGDTEEEIEAIASFFVRILKRYKLMTWWWVAVTFVMSLRKIYLLKNFSAVTECHCKPDLISWLQSPHIILSSSLSHILLLLVTPGQLSHFHSYSHISGRVFPPSASLVNLSPLLTSPMLLWLTCPQQTTLSWSQYRYHPRQPRPDWPSPDPSFHHSRGVIRMRVHRGTE